MQFVNFPYVMVAAAIFVAVAYYLADRKKQRVVRIEHPYFSRVWLWPPGSHTRWEAELDLSLPGVDEKVGFSAETLHGERELDGPTEAEVAFCKEHMAELDRLFELCRPAIAAGWKAWVKEEMPKDWKTALSLNGFSVPENGDIKKPWSITYFCKPARHYFYIVFRDGRPQLESVDG